MNWVRINTTLPDSPEVMQLSEALRIDPDWAFGLAARWLCWLDNFSESGETRCTRTMVDRKFRKGFTAALELIGWAEVDGGGQVHAVNFEKYNGESAKKRAESAVRMAKMRGKRGAAAENKLQNDVASVTEELQKSYGKNVTSASPTIQYSNNNTSLCTTVDIKAAGSTGEREVSEYADWLAPLVLAHPAGREWDPNTPLPADAVAAAAQAFESNPKANEHAELLGAYMSDRLTEDRRGNPFFRPKMLRLFFEQMGTVIAEAKRWQKEKGWKPKAAAKAAVKPAAKPLEPAAEMMSTEDALAEWRKIQGEGGEG